MQNRLLLLDTTAILKRYVYEPGSSVVRKIYLDALNGDITLAYTILSIGEILSALRKAHMKGILGQEQYFITRKRFLNETKRLIKIGRLRIIPLTRDIIEYSWKLVEKYNSSLQTTLPVSAAKISGSELLVTCDPSQIMIAEKESIKILNPEELEKASY